ncbi:MAG: amidohydrolase family protein [Alphaproteobacteria bacterium]|nr:amidohydrolase family protein [Alphaproteobacteria bacterium]
MTNASFSYQPYDAAPNTPKLTLPLGSVDTHMHVFGPLSRYAYTKDRSYTPTDASLDAYLAMAKTVGIARTVVVQPSVYGTNNSATADAVKALGHKRGRGVAVVDASISDEELQQLHEEGFRGIRLNLLFKGGVDFTAVQSLAKRLADRDWHIQFLVDVSEFDNLYERLSMLPVTVVIDHMGHMPAHKGLNNAGFKALLKLVERGNCWVKLSGPYRFTAQTQTPYSDVVPYAQALIAANPERMVWGSDWPHPAINVPMPNDGALVDMLGDWAKTPQLLQQIMVQNPQTLYGFERME